MNISFGNGWTKELKGRVEGFEFEVGILDDKPHRDPIETKLFESPQLGNYAGGPVRQASRQVGPETTAQIFINNQERMNIDLLGRPFREKNAEIIKFSNEFLKWVCKRGGSIRRVENLLQAIVRNPILNQEYGGNKAATADSKGFDRLLFDTGQMFKAIIARAKRV